LMSCEAISSAGDLVCVVVISFNLRAMFAILQH